MTGKDPTTHKYDTDEYTVIDTGIKRCAECGRLKKTDNKDAFQALTEIRTIITAAKTRSDAASRSDYTLLTEDETNRILDLLS